MEFVDVGPCHVDQSKIKFLTYTSTMSLARKKAFRKYNGIKLVNLEFHLS
jgi:hypothetical protein